MQHVLHIWLQSIHQYSNEGQPSLNSDSTHLHGCMSFSSHTCWAIAKTMGCIQVQGMSAGKGMLGITKQHDISRSNDCHFNQYLLDYSLVLGSPPHPLKAIYMMNVESF